MREIHTLTKDLYVITIHGTAFDSNAPQLQTRARLDTGIQKGKELSKREAGKVIFVPTGRCTADLMAQYLINNGISEKDVRPEGKSRSTLEELVYLKRDILPSIEREFKKFVDLLYLTSNYWHGKRIEDDARAILKHKFEFLSAPDPREKAIVDYDIAQEEWKLEMDRLARKLPFFNLLPYLAQQIAYLKVRGFKKYG